MKVKVIGRRDRDDTRKGGDSEKLKGAPLKSSEFLFVGYVSINLNHHGRTQSIILMEKRS